MFKETLSTVLIAADKFSAPHSWKISKQMTLCHRWYCFDVSFNALATHCFLEQLMLLICRGILHFGTVSVSHQKKHLPITLGRDILWLIISKFFKLQKLYDSK